MHQGLLQLNGGETMNSVDDPLPTQCHTRTKFGNEDMLEHLGLLLVLTSADNFHRVAFIFSGLSHSRWRRGEPADRLGEAVAELLGLRALDVFLSLCQERGCP